MDPADLTAHDLRTILEGNLWMLTAEAFLHFLPAFLRRSLDAYDQVSVFASELLGALTEPSPSDVEDALARLAGAPSGPALPAGMLEALRGQQREWLDSNAAAALFHEHFDTVTAAEGAAVLAFLAAFRQAHGEDFPFDEIGIAIGRYWARFGSP
jgi:hypothetical protein